MLLKLGRGLLPTVLAPPPTATFMFPLAPFCGGCENSFWEKDTKLATVIDGIIDGT